MLLDTQFLTGVALLALLTISPGPDTALITAIVLRHGRRAAFFASPGIATGTFLHATASALGLSVISWPHRPRPSPL
jgi:threonine/homoserine/homoserine lactone efflux protein